jgi:uncharacterized protein (TIGR02117 family)
LKDSLLIQGCYKKKRTKQTVNHMKYFTLIIPIIILAACSTKPHVVKQTEITVSSPQEIYIVNHGWHTGFVVPADTIQERLPQLKERFGGTPFIEFGWGDEGFYQAEEITSGLTFRAIMWPTESVVHAAAVPERADRYYSKSDVEVLRLTNTQYSLLISFIEKSFYKGSNGQITQLKSGIYGNSQFYKGEGNYYLMNTCNTWTAKGLKSAGLDISTAFKLSAESIMDYLSEQKETLTQ